MESSGARFMVCSGYTDSVNPDEELVRFERALAEPAAAQDAVRRRILDENRDTEYGRTHGFATVAGYEDFAAALPIVSYEDIEPLMLRMIEGARDVLVARPVVYFGVSSGTTGRPKYVPIHPGF